TKNYLTKMKTQNPIIDNLIESQTQTINNWMDSTKKFQSAFTGGSIATEGQNIYKEWMDKQMDLFNGMKTKFSGSEEAGSKPEEFFKNWYNQQMESAKKMTDFNQSIYNSFSNFGKSGHDYTHNFTNMNSAWTNIYNSWMSTLNSSYDTFMKNIPGSVNKDTFKQMFETNQMYFKLQEFWQPAYKAFQNGDFSTETIKNYFNAESYKKVTEQLFGNYFNQAKMKEVFDASIKKIHEFFGSNNNLAKEYYEQMKNISKQFPQFVGGDFAKLSGLYNNVNDVFGKTFEPLLKLVTPGKEKENIEANIILLDKISEFSVRQAEMQYQFYVTSQKAAETAAKHSFDKLSKGTLDEKADFNEFYNEWVKTNETLFTDMFSSDEFSKIKGEVMNIGMDVKKHFEKQFENVFGVYPIVFRSEVDELTKTIYELKKQIKTLETRIAQHGAASLEFDDEEKTTKAKKK
ncbi:MAG TPA: poly(R)-hydroxyalkanoic acid synthase subunit PhaE, partial [Nitrosopumilaceae archaeon]|nr:poly(R)-hydroxyalkanoic acid synthase subunit PhaE [Nitrosopumilaceae archaeon]